MLYSCAQIDLLSQSEPNGSDWYSDLCATGMSTCYRSYLFYLELMVIYIEWNFCQQTYNGN